ncbi:YhfC family intramembrane metalloprotease [Streptococcus troglodytae]
MLILLGSALFVLLVAFLVVFIFLKRKYQFRFALVGLGALGFLVSSQLLERLLHLLILQPRMDGSNWLMTSHPYLYALYGILAAGLFEETARFLIFKYLSARQTLQNRDAIGYGLGHGGIELLLLGVLQLLNFLLISQMIASGQTEGLSQIVIKQMESLTPLSIFLPVFERLIALAVQILLSIWVYLAVKKKRVNLYVMAIIWHALIDLPAMLYQEKILSNMLLTELILLGASLLLWFLTKRMIKKEGEKGLI